ncbi:hypothetical protein I547_4951 [Mycobacterium kansasii 824]|nr:hypothetical protein I547_4951 [Mycobacterium kansasii 824]
MVPTLPTPTTTSATTGTASKPKHIGAQPATHHIADTRNHNQPRTATDPTAAGIAVLNSPSATPTPYSSQVGCERQFRSRCAANAVVARSGHGESAFNNGLRMWLSSNMDGASQPAQHTTVTPGRGRRNDV